uniref:Receptor for retinol uptake STRA6 n=1 Tax=Trichobilharzia regenti TaxID=157069 RepID=A0AA85J4U2_TRIRE|nr:unnamed protein product [Trichobilharzia regenti]
MSGINTLTDSNDMNYGNNSAAAEDDISSSSMKPVASEIKHPWDFNEFTNIFTPMNDTEVQLYSLKDYSKVREISEQFYLILFFVSIGYTLIIAFLTCKHKKPTDHHKHTTDQHITSSIHHNKQKHYFVRFTTLCLNYLSQYPGLPNPLDFIVYKRIPYIYTSAYMCAFVLISGIFTDNYHVRQVYLNAPLWMIVIYKIFVICFLSITLLPVFLSITYGGLFAWISGLIYCLLNLVFLLMSIIKILMNDSYQTLSRVSMLLPTLLAYLILCNYFLYQIIYNFKHLRRHVFKSFPPNSNSYVQFVMTYVQNKLNTKSKRHYAYQCKDQVNHLERIDSNFSCNSSTQATIPDNTNIHVVHSTSHRFLSNTKFIDHLTFELLKLPRCLYNFCYPTGLIWSMGVSIMLHYFLTIQSISYMMNLRDLGKKYIETLYPSMRMSLKQNLCFSNVKYIFGLFNYSSNVTSLSSPSSSESHSSSSPPAYRSPVNRNHLEYAFVYYCIDIVWIIFLMSITMALIVNMYNICKILLNYHDLSLSVYAKGFSCLPEIEKCMNPVRITYGCIVFPSYQIAALVCGFYLQIILYFLVICFVFFLLSFNLFTPYTFLIEILSHWWPEIIIICASAIIQRLVIQYAYTQSNGQAIGFRNLRSLHQFMYISSFYNIFYGIISSLCRILLYPISSAVSLARLDVASLTATPRCADTGYMTFLGFLYADVMHFNPCLRLFIWIVMDACLRRRHFPLYSSQQYDTAFLMEFESFRKFFQLTDTPVKEANHLSYSSPDSYLTTTYTSSNNNRSILYKEKGVKSKLGMHCCCLFEMNELKACSVMNAHRRRILIRNRWFLYYTLVRNPQLCSHRRMDPI